MTRRHAFGKVAVLEAARKGNDTKDFMASNDKDNEICWKYQGDTRQPPPRRDSTFSNPVTSVAAFKASPEEMLKESAPNGDLDEDSQAATFYCQLMWKYYFTHLDCTEKGCGIHILLVFYV